MLAKQTRGLRLGPHPKQGDFATLGRAKIERYRVDFAAELRPCTACAPSPDRTSPIVQRRAAPCGQAARMLRRAARQRTDGGRVARREAGQKERSGSPAGGRGRQAAAAGQGTRGRPTRRLQLPAARCPTLGSFDDDRGTDSRPAGRPVGRGGPGHSFPP